MIDGTMIKVNDILEFKKPHPCKGTTWEVLRIGVDFKIRCTTCNREIMIPRLDVLKRIKRIVQK